MLRTLRKHMEGSAAMIGVVIALLVSIVVAVLVWYKINTAVFTSFTATTNTAAMNATYANVNTTANTIWALYPIVAIVIIAGVILTIVTMFGQGKASV